MRKHFALLLMVSALIACGAKQESPAPQVEAERSEGAWTIDKAASRITFTGVQTGKEFTGAFDRFDADIVFDPADLPSARIEAVVETGSAKTGDRQRDAALPGADWFAVSAFPAARFESAEVVALSGGRYEAVGTLSIKGVERALRLPFSVAISGGRAVADAELTLNRSDFGIGQGEDFATDRWVGYAVKVAIHIEASR